MTIRKLAALALVSLTVTSTGCSQLISNSNAETTPASQESGNLEAIYGFKATPDEIEFIVQSTGCTKAQHFDLAVTKLQRDDYTISITRNQKDRCRAMSKLISVQLPLKTTLDNKARIKLNNPFAVSISGS